jgi:hypothetical protein
MNKKTVNHIFRYHILKGKEEASTVTRIFSDEDNGSIDDGKWSKSESASVINRADPAAGGFQRFWADSRRCVK